MVLKEITAGLDIKSISGSQEININKIEYDSRKVSEGDLFVCIEGFNVDGHNFAQQAVAKGAKAVICTRNAGINSEVVSVIQVEDSRIALSAAASNYYNHPERRLKLIGITGTNGKTTSAFMIKSILETAGFKVGLMGTIANFIGDKKIPANRTTPESLELFGLLHEMVENSVDYCVLEVSSHSLVLNRVYGLEFNQGIFTNLTRDHLDFHETFENYYNAKLQLFKNSRNSIINIDDQYGKKILLDISGNKTTYSVDEISCFKAQDVRLHPRGAEFVLDYNGGKEKIDINLPGKYNVYNALGSSAACLCEGISLGKVKEGLAKMYAVPGRCEIVTKDYNLGFDIIVDYAHTPDGLENILKTAREFTKGRLISIFGCGGDRDRTKRPLMGKIGSELSDFVIITSDNPRSENPAAIISEITTGIKSDNYIIIEDRRDAIKTAIKTAQKDDVIVLAGKGHEDYQVINGKTIHFDEREVVAEIIKELY
jgi:UDP-N-acetylmuramoyl-L-alanyl-D-glutamate--2,6-diaminopimelate ligase